MRINCHGFRNTNKFNIMDFVPAQSFDAARNAGIRKSTATGHKRSKNPDGETDLKLSDDEEAEEEIELTEEQKFLLEEEARLAKDKQLCLAIHRKQADNVKNEIESLFKQAHDKRLSEDSVGKKEQQVASGDDRRRPVTRKNSSKTQQES